MGSVRAFFVISLTMTLPSMILSSMMIVAGFLVGGLVVVASAFLGWLPNIILSSIVAILYKSIPEHKDTKLYRLVRFYPHMPFAELVVESLRIGEDRDATAYKVKCIVTCIILILSSLFVFLMIFQVILPYYLEIFGVL